MLGPKLIKRTLRSRIVLLGLNLLLGLVALAAGTYLYLRSNPDLIRAFAEEQVRKELAANGMEFSLDSMEIHSLHDIRARNLRLREKGQPGNLAELREVRIALSRRSLLAGSPRIAAVHIRGGRLNCPAISSPSGAEEPVLQDLRAILIPRAGQWTLRNLSFALHNATVTGVFRDGPPLVLKADTSRKPVDTSKLHKLLANLLRAREHLARLDRPALALLSRKDGQVDIHLQALGLQIPELLTCGRLSFHTRAQQEPGHFLFTAPVQGRLDNALLKQDIRVTSLQLRLPAPSTEIKPTLYPLEVELSTGPVQLKTEFAGRFAGRLRMEDKNLLDLDGAVGFLDSYAALSAHANLEKKTAQVKTRFRIEPADIPSLQAFIPREHLQKAKFKSTLGGTLEARFTEDWTLREANFDIEAGQLDILEVPMASLQARGTYVPGRLDVPELAAEFKPGSVRGSFQQDLLTRDYRFLLQGEILPALLNPWFKPWWDDLWAKFQFKGLPLKANIDVSGRWGDLSRRDIYGTGVIHTATYKGTPFKQVHAKLRCIPKYTELFDIDADFPQGHATGRLAWTLHPTERSRVVSRRFDLRGALDLETAGALFGKRVENILDDFTVQEPPSIEATGVLFADGPFDHLGMETLNHFTVQSQAKAATFQSIPLDYLEIDLLNVDSAITIDPLHFGFADGKAEGWLKHRHDPGGPPMEFAFKLKGADKQRTIENLAQNPALKLKPPKPQPKKATFQQFEIHAKGDHGDLTSFEGQGHFVLHDPGLAQLNILGLLFKELKGLALPFISFSFDRMDAQFHLRKHLVVFPKEGIAIKGPTSKVDAEGNLNLKTRGLDMRVRFLPLGLPLAGILEMRLGGSIDEPRWNPKVNPANVVDPKKLQDNIEALDPSRLLKPGGLLPLNPKDKK